MTEKMPNIEFYRGMICSLAIVVNHDQMTIFEEIVDTVCEDELIQVARKDGAMRWSGLSKYLKERALGGKADE